MSCEINLTEGHIVDSLPRLKVPLTQYLWIQSRFNAANCIRNDAEFQTKFNGYYHVGRGGLWRNSFYDLMAESKGKKLSFSWVLGELLGRTGRVEPSFASKLLATIDPTFPALDFVVLQKLNLAFPYRDSRDRVGKIIEFYESLCDLFESYLATERGVYSVVLFRKQFPKANISEIKMLDLAISQAKWR